MATTADHRMNRCPLCGGLNHKSKCAHLSGYDMVKCRHCRHIFTLVKASINSHILYETGDYKLIDTRDSIFDRILNFENNVILKRINKICRRKGRLLDFGCGKGLFLQLAQRNGWTVNGIETSVPRAAYAEKAYGLKISTQEYTGGAIVGAPFDVITFFHVVEHLPNPTSLPKSLLMNNLSNDGLVVFEVPNIDSWQAKIGGKFWMQLDVPRHISHFSGKTFAKLIKILGLKIVRCEFFSWHLGVLGMISSLMSILGYRKNALFELKSNRTPKLVLVLMLLLPLGCLLETLACLFGKGGIIQVYAKRHNDK